MKAADLLQNQEIAKKSTSQVKALLKEALAVLEQADDLPRELRDRARVALTELHTDFSREKGLAVLARAQCDLNDLIMPQGPGGIRL